MTLALEGIKVLDLSRYPPGFVCTMMLGDMGAEVICIESKSKDDNTVDESIAQLRTSLFRNKKSIGLNLKTERGRESFLKLAKIADIIVEGNRPGVAKRLGVDYETVNKVNPRIIYCSITGYGQDGPYRDLPGHDPNFLAFTGVLDATGEKGRKPAVPLNLIGDMAGGSFSAVTGILTAIIARGKTGKGQFVDISMMDGILALYSSIAHFYLEGGEVFKRGEHWMTGGYAWANTYKTADGKYICIACAEPWFWERLCRILGCDEYTRYQFDREKQDEIYSALEKKFTTKTRDEWFNELIKENITISPVYSLDEVFLDPHVIHRKMVVQIDDPRKGTVNQIGIGIKLSETPGSIRSAAPEPGEHTRDILMGAGYSGKQIDEMAADGSIFMSK
jgi:crotonobetainyl-CoA:carnitine CoA-transferase CaiB-like acyl-CoA transferase